MVVSRSGAVVVIAFDEVGTKKVELTACLRKRLLRWPPPRLLRTCYQIFTI